jgi:MSHA pilin protein MshD
MLTVLAMMLMGRLILMVNENNANMGEAVKMSEYRITATSLATSYLEDAMGKEFDEKTLPPNDPPTVTAASCTAPGSLGPESGEVYPNYDDFDDYNGLNRLDTLRDLSGRIITAIYRVRGRVEYVKISGSTLVPETATPTYSKRLTITITSPSILTDNFSYALSPAAGQAAPVNVQDTLVFSVVYSYWRFR